MKYPSLRELHKQFQHALLHVDREGLKQGGALPRALRVPLLTPAAHRAAPPKARAQATHWRASLRAS
jgi:hypothetical protein